MNCEHYQLMISEFMDDELASKEMAPLFAHLAECGPCRGTLQEFINLRARLHAAGDLMTERDRNRVVRHHDAPARHGHVFRRRISISMLTVVLVGAAFLASLLFIIGSAITGENARAPQKNVYVISEPIEVRGYYSTQTYRQQ